MKKLLGQSLLSALGVVAYTAVIATTLNALQNHINQDTPVLAPILFLTLFVTSAAIVGALVLGRPIMMYLDGLKKEAVKMFSYTVGWLALAAIILVLLNIK